VNGSGCHGHLLRDGKAVGGLHYYADVEQGRLDARASHVEEVVTEDGAGAEQRSRLHVRPLRPRRVQAVPHRDAAGAVGTALTHRIGGPPAEARIYRSAAAHLHLGVYHVIGVDDAHRLAGLRQLHPGGRDLMFL
jgi:hypothetical protein